MHIRVSFQRLALGKTCSLPSSQPCRRFDTTEGLPLVELHFAWQGRSDWSHHQVPTRSYLSNRFSTSDIFQYVHCSIYYAAMQLVREIEELRNGLRKD
jgi:hypothetical protein